MAHLGLKESSDASPDIRAVLQKAQSQLGKMPNDKATGARFLRVRVQ